MKVFVFDFDSTIFPGESLDEIIDLSLEGDAEQEEKSKEITSICNLGMSGAIAMEESLKRRLEIAAPSKNTIAEFATRNKDRIDKRISDLLIGLQKSGHHVFVVSGGFEEWIKPLLENIVPAENIHANKIKDTSLPMTFDNIIRRDKEEIIRGLIETNRLTDAEITIVGDGATDFSVFENGIANQFIGTFFYTSLKSRKTVVVKAKNYNQEIFTTLNDFESYLRQYVA